MSHVRQFLKKHRKIRKLVQRPDRFFNDMLLNRLVRPQRRRAWSSYSVVTAVHDAEDYLDEYFASLTTQTLSFCGALEIIVVDDGSTDGSAAIVERWARRYPSNIRVVRQAHRGIAAARNAGLPLATGEWVTFIDADDTIAPNYFAEVDRFIAADRDKGLSLVACRIIVVDSLKPARAHTLDRYFAHGNRVLGQKGVESFVQTSVASAFFERERIVSNELRFEEQLQSGFEDGHFVARYRMLSPAGSVGVCAKARYHFRCSPAHLSATVQSWSTHERFTTTFDFGYQALVLEAEQRWGQYPAWLELTLLYEMFAYYKRLLDRSERTAFLTDQERLDLSCRIERIFEAVDAETILKFNLGDVGVVHKTGWLHRYKGIDHEAVVYVTAWDPVKKLVQLRYFHAGERAFEEILLDDVDVVPVFAKDRQRRFLGSSFVVERYLWIPFAHESAVLAVRLNGTPARLSASGKRQGTQARLSTLRGLLRVRRSAGAGGTGQARKLGQMALSDKSVRRFRDVWVFADRDIRADDNAEALYRYVRRERPDINAVFVLNRSSQDWERLRRDGFRLLRFGSVDHQLALLNAKFLISSHANMAIHDVSARLRGMLTYRFVFLQHGVIKADLSRWLNGRDIACFVVSTQDEYDSIAGDGNNYKFSPREVALSGLPRHDVLLANRIPTERLIAIIPTWRESAVGRFSGKGTDRAINDQFGETAYARHWKSLLHSPALKALVDDFGYKIAFAPHSNVVSYLSWFSPPEYIEVLTFAKGERMKDLFSRLSVMITDFSSVDSETSILGKAVVYYQFDIEEALAGQHSYSLGYFDWKRDGFGPVCENEDAVIGALHDILQRDGAPAPEYLERMHRVFSLRDGQNCKRTLDAVLALDSPVVQSPQAGKLLVDAAGRASDVKQWALAESRWGRVGLLDRADVPSDFELQWARAKRHIGDFEGAGLLLQRLRESGVGHAGLRREAAELATARGDWREARQRWGEVLDGATGDAPDELQIEASCRLAEAARNLGDLATAESALGRARAIGMSEEVQWESAQLASARGCAPAASEAWNAVLSSTTDVKRKRLALLRLAELDAERGAPHAALLRLQDYLRDLSESAEEIPRLIWRIELRLAAGQSTAASEECIKLSKVVARHGSPVDTMRLVALMRRCGLVEAALGLLESEGLEESTGGQHRSERLKLLSLREDWHAILSLTSAVAADASSEQEFQWLLSRLVALRQLGMLQDAEQLAERLAVSHGGTAELLCEQGELAHARGQWHRGAELWMELRRTHPSFQPTRVVTRAAYALEQSGHEAEARQLLRARALEVAMEKLQREPTDLSLLTVAMLQDASNSGPSRPGGSE